MQKRGRTRAVASDSAGTASSPAMKADLQRYQERFLKDLENSDMRAP
jgi:hypothetical protein